MKKISVIIPVYNAEKYLDNCIQSILGQTCDIYEIILIDDGSIDGSSKIIGFPELVGGFGLDGCALGRHHGECFHGTAGLVW